MHEVIGLIAAPLGALRTRLYATTGYLWLAAITSSLLGFAFWAVVTRLYSAEAVGLGGTVVTSIALLARVTHLGLGFALVRFIPKNDDDARFILSRSLLAAVVASVLAGLLFLTTLRLWSHDLGDLLWRGWDHAGAYLVFVIAATVVNLLRFAFIAYRRGAFVLTQRLTLGALSIPLVALMSGLGSAFGIVAAHGLAMLGCAVIAAVVLLPRCTGRRGLPLAFDIWKLAPLMPFALINLASQIMIGLSWQVLPLAVIALAGAKVSGFFYIGWAVAGIVLLMAQQLALALFAEGAHDAGALPRQTRGALAVGLALGAAFAVGVYALGDYVLLLFGRDYVVESGGVLKLLAAATPLAAVTHIYLGVQRVRGRLLPLLAVSAAVTLFMLGVTAALVPRIGIAGAGYGVLAGYGVGALLSLPLLWPMVRHGGAAMEMATAD